MCFRFAGDTDGVDIVNRGTRGAEMLWRSHYSIGDAQMIWLSVATRLMA